MKNLILLFAISMMSVFTIQAQNEITYFNTSSEVNEAFTKKTIKTPLSLKLKVKSEVLDIINSLDGTSIYPEIAEGYNAEGKVVLEAWYDGELKDISIKEGDAWYFNKAAVKAMEKVQNTFNETDHVAVPKPFKIVIPFQFSI